MMRKIQGMTFVPDVDTETPQFILYMAFRSVHELKDAITKYAVKNGHGIWFKNSERDKLTTVCKPGCKSILHASMESYSNTSTIKMSYSNTHIVENFRTD